jgi:hypothetical protein
MRNISAKEKNRAWQKAKTDADAVECVVLGTPDARGEHSRREGRLLDRLRSQEYADQIGEAWLGIEKYQKTTGDGQRVVRCLLHALTLSYNAPRMLDDYQRSLEELEALKSSADQLYSYFSNTINRDPPWKIVAGDLTIDSRDFRSMRANLRRITTFLSNRMDNFQKAFQEIGLTREIGTESARRVVFTAALSDSMLKIFGKPLDGIVQTLAEVALGEETTLDQVRHARVNAASRKRRTDHQKI